MASYKDRMALRQLYKRYMAGLVAWEDISPEDKALLIKYYGLDNNGW